MDYEEARGKKKVVKKASVPAKSPNAPVQVQKSGKSKKKRGGLRSLAKNIAKKVAKTSKSVAKKAAPVFKKVTAAAKKVAPKRANVKTGKVIQGDNKIGLMPIKTITGNTVHPYVREDNTVLAPKVVEPIEIENPESFEEPVAVIEPEITDEGEVVVPELVEEEGADGENNVSIKFTKIPPAYDENGNVIMPYKMACGSVVTTDEVFKSANGNVYHNATGNIIIEEPMRLSNESEEEEKSAEGFADDQPQKSNALPFFIKVGVGFIALFGLAWYLSKPSN